MAESYGREHVGKNLQLGSKERKRGRGQGLNIPFFFFLVILGLELRAYTLSHSTALFCDGFFCNRVLQTICQAGFELQSF
jgi:hypothetical protein